MKNFIIYSFGALLFVGVTALTANLFIPRDAVEANVALGGQYAPVGTGHSTSTGQAYNVPSNLTIIRSGRGTFGSVVVTGSGSATGNLEFYDASTTLRLAEVGSSTRFIGAIANDQAVGEYPFDIELREGLLMYFTGTAATIASTTILTR